MNVYVKSNIYMIHTQRNKHVNRNKNLVTWERLHCCAIQSARAWIYRDLSYQCNMWCMRDTHFFSYFITNVSTRRAVTDTLIKIWMTWISHLYFFPHIWNQIYELLPSISMWYYPIHFKYVFTYEIGATNDF